MSVDKALKYAAQICDALDAAHKKNVTHRDLKPGNILVTKAGVKLLDFGLARITDADATVTMAVMGTLAYMSPEQWEGKPGDARSDIYALGCVLHEMLTGKRVSPQRAAVEPGALESVLRTCLEKEADERWQSAHDVKRALEVARQAPAPSAPAARKIRWAALIAAAVFFAAAIYFFVAARPRTADSGAVVSFAVYPPEKTNFSPAPNTTSNVPQFALSPDGRTLAFVANTLGSAPMLWLRPLAEVPARPLPGTENATQPFWSPDNRWLGFFADGRIKKVPAAGGAVQVITEPRSDFRGGAWGPDDTILFGTGAEAIYRINAQGGEAAPVTADLGSPLTDRYPAFLPDGRHFLHQRVVPEQTGVFAGSLDGKTKKLLLQVNNSAAYAPAPNMRGGYLLFVDGDTLMAQAFDSERLEVSGRPFLVAEHAGHNTAFYSGVSASLAGPIAYAGTISQNGRLTWFDRSGNALGSAGPEGDYTDFRLSPDEKSLAASLVDAKAGTVDIWINDMRRNNMSRFSAGRAVTATPVWAPDSSRLVYRSFQTGLVAFYQRSAGGRGDEARSMAFRSRRREPLGTSLKTAASRHTETGTDCPHPAASRIRGSDLAAA